MSQVLALTAGLTAISPENSISLKRYPLLYAQQSTLGVLIYGPFMLKYRFDRFMKSPTAPYY